MNLRWMIRRDLGAVLEIEKYAFEFPWDEATFIDAMRERNTIGKVIEDNDEILGYVIYRCTTDSMCIESLAVHHNRRRLGLGSTIVDDLKSRLTAKRFKLFAYVRETNFSAQKFFRAQDFKAKQTVKGHFDDTDEAAYCFEFSLRGATVRPPILTNRITHNG
jgi:ribosomal-protein-alanine N-acetyltransferase